MKVCVSIQLLGCDEEPWNDTGNMFRRLFPPETKEILVCEVVNTREKH